MKNVKFNEAINEKYISLKKKMFNIKTNDEYIVPETGSIVGYLNRGDILLEVEDVKNGKKEWVKVGEKPISKVEKVESKIEKKIKE
ncbi:MAG TPA: hypothetical protein PKJ39_06175 [Caldisericia bacterium]|mgnify:CR=1 FL=1|nr:hypothetical protein [Caldisericia bacterium]